MPGTPHIVGFEDGIGDQIPLHTQVVLVNARRAQMRIIEIYESRAVHRQERGEVDVRCWRLRRKSIRDSSGSKRIRHITDLPVVMRWLVEEKSRIAHKGRLPVELQIVLALQDVEENTDTAADAGLSTSGWIPGKAEPWREVILDGKVRTARNARIAGKHHTRRSVYKARRLQPRDH